MKRRNQAPRLGGNCAPWVVARLTGRPVEDTVAEVLARRRDYGSRRNVGGGTPQALTRDMLAEAGIKLVSVPVESGKARWVDYVDRYGYARERYRRAGHTTVAAFIRDNPTGTYVVRISAHIMVVEDGELFDNQRPTGAGPSKFRYARSRVVSADRVDSRGLGQRLRGEIAWTTGATA